MIDCKKDKEYRDEICDTPRVVWGIDGFGCCPHLILPPNAPPVVEGVEGTKGDGVTSEEADE